MSDNGWWSIALVVCIVIALLVGIGIGAKIGSNSIAEKWCESEGFATGFYGWEGGFQEDKGEEKRAVCLNALPIVTKGE